MYNDLTWRLWVWQVALNIVAVLLTGCRIIFYRYLHRYGRVSDAGFEYGLELLLASVYVLAGWAPLYKLA